MRKMREQKGYITIEATIVLSIYIFAFMMIFSLIHICRAQMKISVAINKAAKEISEYSYLYGASGLSDSMYKVGQSAAQTQQEYSGLAEDVELCTQKYLHWEINREIWPEHRELVRIT